MNEEFSKSKKSASEWNEEGINYFEKKQFQKAMECFLAAVEINPRDPSFFKNIAETYFRLGNVKQAIGNYHRAIQLNNQRADYHNDLGFIYEECNHNRAALSEFQKAYSLDPINKEYLENQAKILRKIGEHHQALRLYLKIFKITPKDAYIINNVGISYFNLQRYQEALHFFKLALNIKPKNITYLQNIADCLRFLNEYTKAIEFYQQIVEKEPKDDLSWNYLGMCFLFRNEHMKDLHHAKQSFRRALKINASKSRYWKNLGCAYRLSHQYSSAIIAYKKSLNNPDPALLYLIYNNLGLCYFFKKTFSEAKNWFKKALIINKNDPVILENYIASLIHLKKWIIAYVYLKKLKKLKQFDDYLNNSYGYCLLQIQRFNIAEKYLQAALTSNPLILEYNQNLFELYIKSKMLKKAFVYLKKIDNMIQIEDSFYYNIGKVFYKDEFYSEAEFCFTKILINTKYKNSLLYRALCYKKMGKKKKALQDYHSLQKK